MYDRSTEINIIFPNQKMSDFLANSFMNPLNISLKQNDFRNMNMTICQIHKLKEFNSSGHS